MSCMRASTYAKLAVSLSIPIPSIMVSYRCRRSLLSDCSGAYATPCFTYARAKTEDRGGRT